MGRREQFLEYHQKYSEGKEVARFINKTTTADLSNISYDPYQSMHVFTKNAPKPTYNVCIVTSHVLLPTFWCSKWDSWSSHHDTLHDERLRWQAMKNAQLSKQEPLWSSAPTKQIV
jgi:hypothetical protein